MLQCEGSGCDFFASRRFFIGREKLFCSIAGREDSEGVCILLEIGGNRSPYHETRSAERGIRGVMAIITGQEVSCRMRRDVLRRKSVAACAAAIRHGCQ